MTTDEFNVNDRITIVEARKILQVVTLLAKSCSFNHLEGMKIIKVCQDCLERLEKEN